MPTLTAYPVYPQRPMMELVAAPSVRPWMHATQERFANRCLPMLIANQAGWLILNNQALSATWAGADDPRSLSVDYANVATPHSAKSHFGHGILTWHVPYLFRTSPGYNLLVRGPANYPKDGVYPLEGIVETDWAFATFTMNWKLTRVGIPISFDVGEPICMIVPQRRGELEVFRPEICRIEDQPEIRRGHVAWSQNREQFLAQLNEPDANAVAGSWQKHYFRGVSPGGERAPDHQLKLQLSPFRQAANGESSSVGVPAIAPD